VVERYPYPILFPSSPPT